jgi:hypothetical protein
MRSIAVGVIALFLLFLGRTAPLAQQAPAQRQPAEAASKVRCFADQDVCQKNCRAAGLEGHYCYVSCLWGEIDYAGAPAPRHHKYRNCFKAP